MQTQALAPDASSNYWSYLTYLNPCPLICKVVTNWRQSVAIASVAFCIIGLASAILTGSLIALFMFIFSGIISTILASELEFIGNLDEKIKDLTDVSSRNAYHLKVTKIHQKIAEDQLQAADRQLEARNRQLAEQKEENKIQKKLNEDLKACFVVFENSMGIFLSATQTAHEAAGTVGTEAKKELDAAAQVLNTKLQELVEFKKVMLKERSAEIAQFTDLLAKSTAAEQLKMMEITEKLHDRARNLEAYTSGLENKSSRLETQIQTLEQHQERTHAIIKKLEKSMDEEFKGILDKSRAGVDEHNQRLSAERKEHAAMWEELKREGQQLLKGLEEAKTEFHVTSAELREATAAASPYVPRKTTGSRQTSAEGVAQRGPHIERDVVIEIAGAPSAESVKRDLFDASKPK